MDCGKRESYVLYSRMPQTRKDHVREAIVAAAAHELAHVGFEGATLQAIARRAGTSIGNLYKYFPDKRALCAAAVPAKRVRELERLLDERAAQVGPRAAAMPDALLRFATEHRLQLLFLLGDAGGTPHAGFAEALVEHMTALAKRRRPRAGRALERTLRRIYRGWVATLASILAEERDPERFTEANALFLAYHLAGLKELLAA